LTIAIFLFSLLGSFQKISCCYHLFNLLGTFGVSSFIAFVPVRPSLSFSLYTGNMKVLNIQTTHNTVYTSSFILLSVYKIANFSLFSQNMEIFMLLLVALLSTSGVSFIISVILVPIP
jgi:hypothetical protein